MYAEPWVRNPAVKLLATSERTRVEFSDGRSLTSGPELAALLAAFEQPKLLPETRSATLEQLIDHGLIVPHGAAAFMAGGILRQSPVSIGPPKTLAELRVEPGVAAVIGSPTDFARAGDRSPAEGPDAVRRAVRGLGGAWDGRGGTWWDPELQRSGRLGPRTVVDLGDIRWQPGRDTLEAVGARLGFAVRRVLDCGVLPILVGGDHSVSYFSMRETLNRFGRLRVLHFDAHFDTRPTDQLDHSSVMGRLMADPRVTHVHHIGARDLAHHGVRFADRVTVFSSRQLLNCRPQDVFAACPPSEPLYLTCDIDVLSPAVAPEVTNPRIGGLTYYQLLDLFCWAVEHLNVVMVDFMEVCGPAAVGNQAAAAAARLIASLVACRVPQGAPDD